MFNQKLYQKLIIHISELISISSSKDYKVIIFNEKTKII